MNKDRECKGCKHILLDEYFDFSNIDLCVMCDTESSVIEHYGNESDEYKKWKMLNEKLNTNGTTTEK